MKITFTNTKLNYRVARLAGAFFLITGFLISTVTKTQAQIINTIAGNGSQSYGGDGQAATYASLNLPLGVAVDDSGNVYIADEFNDRIRKVTAKTGIIRTIAGGGSNAGTDGLGDGGPSTGSSMYSPTGVAVDDSGNVYCVDDNRIRKITKTTGIITSIAGNGTWSYAGDDGPAQTAAELRALTVAIGDSGNIFIADFQNNRVREIRKATGIINTVVGTGFNAPMHGGYTGDGGLATNAELDYPSNVAIDDSGNIYIADDGNEVIRKVTIATGIITTVAGNGFGYTTHSGGYTGDGGQAIDAELNEPAFIVLDDSSNIYIADRFNERIRKVTAKTGIINTFAGDSTGGYSGDNGAADSAELNEPGGLAQQCGNIYIADWGNSRIRKVKVTGPTPTNSIISSITTICPGKSVTFRDSANFDATNFTWSFFGGTPDTSTISNPVITYDKAGTYYLTVNASNTCYSVFNTFLNYVKVVTPPALTVVPASATVCNGQSVTLEVTSGGTGFTWSPSTGLNITTGDSVISTPSATVTYTVSGTDSTGCAATGTSVVTMGISPNKPSFAQHDDTLISSSKNDNQWYRNDTLLTNDTSQYLIITTLGEYWVVVNNEANGCSTASDSMNISSLTGVKQLSVSNEELSIYPNPFSNQLTIISKQSLIDEIDVTNELGQMFLKVPFIGFKDEIDLSNLSSGVYFISVINKTGRTIVPVVKQN